MQDRLIDLDGSYNFRDIGGYDAYDNKKVKRGLLYRADTLSKLSEADIEKLKALDISTIVDYRSEDERYNNEDKQIKDEIVYKLDPIAKIAEMAANGGSGSLLDDLTEEKVTQFLCEENSKFVTSKRGKEVYSEMLQLALNSPGAFVQHCTAGKDRTGYGVALILLLLQVSKEDVISDYLLTNEAVKNKPTDNLALEFEDDKLIKALKLLEGVKVEYLNSALNIIFDEYEGIEDYVIKELNFSEENIQDLRDKYLE